MDDVPGEAPNDPASDPQPQQGPWDQREQHEQRQYASAPFPAMTAIQAMSGVSGNAALPSMSPQLSRPGHKLPFVQPSSYLRPKTRSRTTPVAPTPMSPVDEEQMQGLKGLRDFLRVRTSYDVLPLSFRLIVLDNDLLIKKSLNILVQNGIVSAPLWDSHNSRFAGLLTSTDYINLIQYYCQFPEQVDKVEEFRLSSLRVDIDDETGRETIVSVITQYRILKFIAVNTEQHTMLMKKTVREIGLGTYKNLITAKMTDTVLDVINQMVVENISAVPIIDKNNVVLNVFEAVDVIPCIKGGVYEELKYSVGEAMCKRADDFPGIYTCQEDDRLESIFTTLRQSRVHRLVVIDDNWHLKGMISLSDILKYVLFYGDEDFPTST
ncbi:putative nuclear protein snf4 protein [Eutypa lata UCREL1]|uniref:Putative nuclear protein snf4 protein n=1 Tax=Eutypa lata (strain UCR-EL1) TaxID=1287681 RepID=M7SWL8_EUTLA|nr:putative nuclear protein snf4 protein [Eutypa lata UCREL1]